MTRRRNMATIREKFSDLTADEQSHVIRDHIRRQLDDPSFREIALDPIVERILERINARVVGPAIGAAGAELVALRQGVAAMQASLAQLANGVDINPPGERQPTTPEDPIYGRLTWSGETRPDPRAATRDVTISQTGRTNP
jgi:hypothetical protein